MINKFTVGLDYGTNSVRALITNTSNGNVLGVGVFDYLSGEDGILSEALNSQLARHNPEDYIRGFVHSIKIAICQAQSHKEFRIENIVGIGISTTGSSPLPVDKRGIPLSMLPQFKNDLSSYIWLWKDHTANVEAKKITQLVNDRQLPYLKNCGGTYSSEWFWSKILHCLNISEEIFKAAYSWVEICDFIPAYVCNGYTLETIKRSACAAGHKAMFNHAWGGLPSKSFLEELHPELNILRDRLYSEIFTSDKIAGFLSKRFSLETGIPSGIPVTVGGFDVHHGAIGVGIKEGVLVKAIGTSTCDIVVTNPNLNSKEIPGICGSVKGSVLPNMIGIEAGQSAVGDIFKWFIKKFYRYKQYSDSHQELTKQAKRIHPGESGLIALDWNNGNRTVLADHELTGLILGHNLHTNAAEIYRTLLEATAFGALTIIKHLKSHDIEINEIICCGGIANKNDLMMQIYADILNYPIYVNKSSQACALGSSIFAATASGIYENVTKAQIAMAETSCIIYKPIQSNVDIYKKLYVIYSDLHDSFSSLNMKTNLSHVMKTLLHIKKKSLLTNVKTVK